jgi:hypothetical protein
VTLRWGAASVVALALVAGGGYLVLRPGPAQVLAQCTGTVGKAGYYMDVDQGRNATTIAAEAHKLGLPAHAISIGLAAALQESKLRNLSYGDRDSLGLFQQRPSQGWGTPAQLQQSTYAAAAFFRGLAKVPGWETLAIYQAAQKVQRSADASAYAVWDTESRTIAQGLTGQVPAGFSCTYPSVPASSADTAHLLASQARGALGDGAFDRGIDASYGWIVASWLVSRATTYAVDRVGFDGWTWTPKAGWAADATATATAAQVSYEMKALSSSP